jgi:hypothetical protein
MKRHGVRRVVTVSGVGRRQPEARAGVVGSALAKDRALEEAGLDARALWCPGLMENALRNLESLRAQGIFAGRSRPDVEIPYLATRDVAAVGARLSVAGHALF